jgi:hypothetical protein
MDMSMDRSASERARYRVSELPPHHFDAADDETLGAIASRTALSQMPWTPDVAPAVIDRLARDAVAYPEQFAPGARRPSTSPPESPMAGAPGSMKQQRVTRRTSRGPSLAAAGVAAVIVVAGASLFITDRLASDPSDTAAGGQAMQVTAERPQALPAVVAPAAAVEDDRGEVEPRPLTIVAAGPVRDGKVGARVRLAEPLGDVAAEVHRTQLLRKAPGGSWRPVASANGGGPVETTLVPGKRYDFRILTLDGAGRPISSRRLRAILTVRHWASEHIDRTRGDWTTTTGDPELGGALASRTADAAITTSFKGDGVALVAPVGPTGGAMRIRVDGGEWETGDLGVAEPTDRAVVFSRHLETGLHSLDIGVADGVITLDSMMIVRTPEAWPPRS